MKIQTPLILFVLLISLGPLLEISLDSQSDSDAKNNLKISFSKLWK